MIVRNKGNKLSHDDLRSVNKSLGMVNMKDQVKGETVDRCKVVKKDWFAYNPMRLNVGSICRWELEDNCLVGPDYVVFYCNEELLLTEYFDQFRRSHKWNDFMVRAGNGSVRVRIYLKDLTPLKLVLPPLPEQKKIARILSTWDRAIEVTEKLLKNSQQQKKALMQQLLTGKKRLPGFSGEWNLTTIGSVCSTFSGGTPSRMKHQYYGGDIPWIKSGEVNDRFISSVSEYITEEGLNNSSAKRVKKDSILVAMYGATAGKVAINLIEDAAINQAILALTPGEKYSHIFMFYLIEREMNKALSLVQGGQPNLNAAIIKNIKVDLPALEEQQKIASILSEADKEIEILEQKLDCLRQEKKALMQQLLTGKRRVKVDEDELPQKETVRA